MILTDNGKIIKARKVIQNNQEFLIGTFQIRQVRKFTKYTEHLIVDYEELELSDKDEFFLNQKKFSPIYNPEIQRKTNNAKVEKIADFLIYDPTAMFPTNIVIAIPNQVIDSFTDNNGLIEITLNDIVEKEIQKDDGEVYLTIIDGQHRIRGIERAIERVEIEIKNAYNVLTKSENKEIQKKLEYSRELLNRLLNFELLVTFFVDPTLEYQAMIFATINKTQTKVPENLVYSLFGLTKDDSPQKTSLEVVLALNGIEKSPFFNRIKLVGGNYIKGEMVPLSQATMVKSILKNISNNIREAETDRFKKRIEMRNNPNNLPFRKYYSSNNDGMIVRIIYSYFSAIRDTFLDGNDNSLWQLDQGGKINNVLQTNVGYQALLKLLVDLLKLIPEDLKDKKSSYLEYLVKAKSLDLIDDKHEKRYPFTSSTINILYNDLKVKIFS